MRLPSEVVSFHVSVIIHICMNDDTNVNTWQDGIVTEQNSAPSADEVAEHAPITTVEQLKALADPIRLAILETLMSSRRALPVMSVKELAEALREPQTKLYRHMKVLESAGLIRVAATRMVSGIAEQRYMACQRDLDLANGLLRQHIDETEAIFRAVLDRFRSGFFAAMRVTPPPPDEPEDRPPLGKNSAMITASGRRSPAQADAVRARLADALAYFEDNDSDDPDAVPMNLLIGFYIQRDTESP
jgi:DNA-binding transcriptional ArsR family regulator